VKAWKDYHTYLQSTRKVFLTRPERDAYKDNEAAPKAAIKFLFTEFLLNNQEIAEPGSLVPDGCVNELNRIVAAHGISDRDIPLRCIAVGVSWLYDYILRYWSTESVDASPIHAAKTRFASLLAPVRAWLDYSKYPTLESLSQEAATVLSQILMEWRKDFIRFKDTAIVSQMKGVPQVSKGTRDKLSESIKGAIEKDFLGKRSKAKQ